MSRESYRVEHPDVAPSDVETTAVPDVEPAGSWEALDALHDMVVKLAVDVGNETAALRQQINDLHTSLDLTAALQPLADRLATVVTDVADLQDAVANLSESPPDATPDASESAVPSDAGYLTDVPVQPEAGSHG